MDQAKRALEGSRHETEPQDAAPASAPEVRLLEELELVLCGGGDSGIAWPG